MQKRGSSTNRKWLEKRRGSRDFLLSVHLIPQLLEAEMAAACCFSRFDLATRQGYPEDFLTKQKRNFHVTLRSFRKFYFTF